MLVLSRRVGETIILGDDIRVTVLAAPGGQVRLGISAPEEVIIMREEVAARRRQESSNSGNS
jgi:carbon storage regulator